MAFGERLKKFRKAAGMTQQELADTLNVTRRTVINYEKGAFYPQKMEIVKQAANVLGITLDELMDEEDYCIIDAGERGGGKARRDVQQLAVQVAGLFAGGELDDEDKDAAMRAITEAYWKAKEKNKKYTPKKYRK